MYAYKACWKWWGPHQVSCRYYGPHGLCNVTHCWGILPSLVVLEWSWVSERLFLSHSIVCIHTVTYTYIQTDMCVHACVRAYIHTHVQTSKAILIWCIYIYIYTCVYEYACVRGPVVGALLWCPLRWLYSARYVSKHCTKSTRFHALSPKSL